ncbi:MAG: hypothetical protein ACXABO_18100 [Promethearchaeota archaeon]|jgi:hypothetical protein
MPKHKKTGWYEHLGILIFAQGKWHESDREKLLIPIRKKREVKTDNPYPFYLKLTLRKDPPDYPDCGICHLLDKLFKDIRGPNDGILFLGHHYILFEDDVEEMKDMTKLILSGEKVKKFYLLYIQGFSEIKTTVIRKMNITELKELINHEKYDDGNFIEVLDKNEFKARVLYEVTKY